MKPVLECVEVEPVIGHHNHLAIHDRARRVVEEIRERSIVMPLGLGDDLFAGGGDKLQNVDWYAIYKSKDLGRWSHGGGVCVQSF